MKQVNKHILPAVIFFTTITSRNAFSMKIVKYNPKNTTMRKQAEFFLDTYLQANHNFYKHSSVWNCFAFFSNNSNKNTKAKQFLNSQDTFDNTCSYQ